MFTPSCEYQALPGPCGGGGRRGRAWRSWLSSTDAGHPDPGTLGGLGRAEHPARAEWGAGMPPTLSWVPITAGPPWVCRDHSREGDGFCHLSLCTVSGCLPGPRKFTRPEGMGLGVWRGLHGTRESESSAWSLAQNV